MPDIVLVYTTWPDAETAEAAAAGAVADRLAACANIHGPVESIYHWQGAMERKGEIPVLFKTQAAMAPALRDYLVEMHPYETPCVVAVPVNGALSADGYLNWVAQQTPEPGVD
jgi:periplasmic divalent cation tolerance protein